MNGKDVIDFFDQLAPAWDENLVRNEHVISTILNCAGIRANIDVLDVACGTGVLFPDYINREVASLTAIDISSEMVRIARSKFPDVDVVCGDILDVVFSRQFDAIVVYNAFPHFVKPERLIQKLAEMLKPQGRLTIAHGMSREELNSHHRKRAQRVSAELMHEDELARLMARWIDVDIKVSDAEKYIVSGKLR